MPIRFLTAGESHGKALVAIVEGIPAGLPITAAHIDDDLRRRMQGYGRGARMKIEQDRVELLAGIRAGQTLGSPIALLIPNRDWTNWEDVMSAEGEGEARRRRVVRPRPGHADLVGVLKYDRDDARDILERASARETTARVAAGAVARRLLDELQIEVGSHLISLGGCIANPPSPLPTPLNAASDASQLRTLDPDAELQMVALIDAAKKSGDTLGGEPFRHLSVLPRIQEADQGGPPAHRGDLVAVGRVHAQHDVAAPHRGHVGDSGAGVDVQIIVERRLFAGPSLDDHAVAQPDQLGDGLGGGSDSCVPSGVLTGNSDVHAATVARAPVGADSGVSCRVNELGVTRA